jgi:hypothetical protein
MQSNLGWRSRAIVERQHVKAARALAHVTLTQKSLRRAQDDALFVSGHAQFRQRRKASGFTVRVRTSTNASVSPSYPIKSISPFTPRGM